MLEPQVPGEQHHVWNQLRPSVDSDGRHFAVAYEDNWFMTAADWDIRTTLYHHNDFSGTIGVSESRAWLGSS